MRLLAVANPHAQAFYETESVRNGWSVRQLDRQVGRQYYERHLTDFLLELGDDFAFIKRDCGRRLAAIRVAAVPRRNHRCRPRSD